MSTAINEIYDRDGFVFPIDILDAEEAAQWRSDYERCEALWKPRADAKATGGFPHLVFPEIAAMARDPRILNPVTEILGEDLLVWNVTFWTKEPQSANFVSWHQDLNYWGLDEVDEVTAWVALSEVNENSGCMRFIKGSHLNRVEHRDTFAQDNMLTRGQEVDAEVDESKAVSVELKPGQMSLHHGLLMHASGPNNNDDRRIGCAIRYIKPTMQQVGVKGYAMLAQGKDNHGNFQHVEPPALALDQDSVAMVNKIREQHEKILFREV